MIYEIMPKIILASTSPRRKELLESIGLKFEIQPSDYEEDMTLKMPPKKLAEFLSLNKARSVAQENNDAIVIGADTIVVLGKQVLGKPHTEKEAKKMLKMISGKVHSVITGVTVIDTSKNIMITKSVETKVWIKKLSPKEIESYVASKEPLDKAGAYAIQGLGSLIVKKIEGDYSNVVGLPLFALREELEKIGVKIL